MGHFIKDEYGEITHRIHNKKLQHVIYRTVTTDIKDQPISDLEKWELIDITSEKVKEDPFNGSGYTWRKYTYKYVTVLDEN